MKLAAPEEVEKSALPEGWRWSALGAVCTLNPSRPPLRDRADDAPTSFVPMPAVDERTGTIARIETKPFLAVKKGYTCFGNGDVIFAKITPCMQNGKHAIARDLIDGIAFGSTEFHVLRPGSEVIAEWVWLYLRREEIKAQAATQFNGAVGQQRVPEGFLESLAIPLPPLPEQKRLAAILTERLDAIERARVAAEEQLVAARALPAARLREVFGSAEAQKWPTRTLGEVSAIVGGIQKSPHRAPRSFHRPFLTVRNVQRGYLDLSQVERFEITEAELARLRLMDKDILIVEGNGSLDHIGRNALFRGDGEEWIHQNHVIRVRVHPGTCIPEFISLYLNSNLGKDQMVEKAKTTSGLYTLSTGKVAALEVPVPDLADQARAVEDVGESQRKMQALLEHVETELVMIERLSTTLLREAFAGKLTD